MGKLVQRKIAKSLTSTSTSQKWWWNFNRIFRLRLNNAQFCASVFLFRFTFSMPFSNFSPSICSLICLVRYHPPKPPKNDESHSRCLCSHKMWLTQIKSALLAYSICAHRYRFVVMHNCQLVKMKLSKTKTSDVVFHFASGFCPFIFIPFTCHIISVCRLIIKTRAIRLLKVLVTYKWKWTINVRH